MRSRRLILGLILLTLLAVCLAAAAKLRGTPKYDRIKIGMDWPPPVLSLEPVGGPSPPETELYDCDEGRIEVTYEVTMHNRNGSPSFDRVVVSKRITRRGPLERLAWLAGWR